MFHHFHVRTLESFVDLCLVKWVYWIFLLIITP